MTPSRFEKSSAELFQEAFPEQKKISFESER